MSQIEISCPRCRTDLVLPSRDGEERSCPVCELLFEVEDGTALYSRDEVNDGQLVECEAYEAHVEVPYRDGDYVCPECAGDISVHDRVAQHEPMEWVECPSSEEETLVGLNEDGSVECECGQSITISDGEAVHEDVFEVECLKKPGFETVVACADLEDDETVECAWCSETIGLNHNGEPVHGAEPEVVSTGDGRSVYVLVHGFRNDADKDYSEWESQLRTLGWTGDVLGFQWPAPLEVSIEPLQGVGPVIMRPTVLVPALAGVALAQVLASWKGAVVEAERQGPVLAGLLRELCATYSDVRVLAHSLGTRVVHFALEDLSHSPAAKRIRVRLCAGAFPIDVLWSGVKDVVHGPIENYWSDGDNVLRYFFRAGNLWPTAPIGLTGLENVRPRSRLRNREAIVDDAWIGHDEYETNFAHFGRL